MRMKELDSYVEKSLAQRCNDNLREQVETILRNERGFRELPDDQQLEILNTLLGKSLRRSKEFRRDYIKRQRRFRNRFKK